VSDQRSKVVLEDTVVPLPGVRSALEPICWLERCPSVHGCPDWKGCTTHCRLVQAYTLGWTDGCLYERGELE
jgi:hypothetical protein